MPITASRFRQRAGVTPLGWLLAGSTVWLDELLPRTRGLIGLGRYIAVVLAGGVVLGVAGALAWRLTRTSGPARGRASSLDQPRKRR